jgi:hypothetical protein
MHGQEYAVTCDLKTSAVSHLLTIHYSTTFVLQVLLCSRRRFTFLLGRASHVSGQVATPPSGVSGEFASQAGGDRRTVQVSGERGYLFTFPDVFACFSRRLCSPFMRSPRVTHAHQVDRCQQSAVCHVGKEKCCKLLL